MVKTHIALLWGAVGVAELLEKTGLVLSRIPQGLKQNQSQRLRENDKFHFKWQFS